MNDGGAVLTDRALLERDQERGAIARALDGAQAGAGSVLLVEGPPGIGKTALVGATHRRVEASRLLALRARGSELERDSAFGIPRQLFEATLVKMGDEDRARVLAGAAALSGPLFEGALTGGAPRSGGDPFPMLHGLHWLCANLASVQPLLLTVDDAHWADQPSLRFLHYLAARIEELPVVLMVTARSTRPESPVEEIEALRSLPGFVSIVLRPLSERGTSELLAGAFEEEVETGFAETVWQASGGNPFLVTELTRSLIEEGVSPREEFAASIGEASPTGVTRTVLARLGRMPEEARAVARAAAILGDGASLREAAALADIDADAAARGADALAAAGVLQAGTPLTFVHPLIRAAVDGDQPPNQRAGLHSRAAEVLAAQGASPERAANHLLLAQPEGDEDRITLLREAANEAVGKGAPGVAAEFLTRALEEGPSTEGRSALLRQLGEAEAQAQIPAGVEHLREALDLTDEDVERGGIAGSLALALMQSARFPEAVQLLQGELDAQANASSEVTLELESELAATLLYSFDRDFESLDSILVRLETKLDYGTRSGRQFLAVTGARSILRGEEAGPGTEMIGTALAAGLMDDFPPGSPPITASLHALGCADEWEAARRWGAEAGNRARSAGMLVGAAQASNFLSLLEFNSGTMAEAEALADEALSLCRAHGIVIGIPPVLAAMVDPMVERGEAEAAWGLVEELGLAGDLPPIFTTSLLAEARGRVRLALGDPAGALHDLLDAGERYARWGVSGPGCTSWRAHAAMAHVQLEQRDEARRLAAEDLELARRFGTPRPTAVALRALGLAEGGDGGLELLTQAVSTLEGTAAAPERARAQVELGSALRRSGRTQEARKRLAAGLDGAARVGARVLAERAREELRAAGAKPRRELLSGVEALTASERRVADMAADGLTNPQIAQALFVTRKTVEKHLGSTYMKLDIKGRTELRQALAEPLSPEPRAKE